MKHIYLILFIIIAIFTDAQNVSKNITQGDRLFKTGQYFSASSMYKSALDVQYNHDLAYKYAEACRLDYNFKEAEKYYKRISLEQADKYPMLYFNLGLVQKGLGKYNQAKRSFSRFLSVHKTDDFYKKRAIHENTSCQKAFEMAYQKKSTKINHCDSSVNSNWGELMIYEIDSTKYLFSALRPDTLSENQEVLSLKASIFYYDKNKPKQDSVFFTSAYQNEDYNISSFCFNTNKSLIFVTRCKLELEKYKCRIWKAKIENNKIGNFSKLSSAVNFPASNSIHPSISKIDDKEILFFASNRNGGYGKYDIWYSEVYEDGSVSSAHNLGENINTIDNEITPFYDSKHEILYFSSEWYNNLGFFDIFKSSGNLDYWGDAENLGAPINSSYNDYYYRINQNQTKAYFSSNRDGVLIEKGGNCCPDLFKIDLPKENEELIVNIPEVQSDMKQLIPITLYFHNDEPNPKTRDTSTTLTYQDAYLKYTNMLEEYEKEYSKGLKKTKKEEAINAIDEFFSEKVDKGFGKLVEFNFLLKQILEKNEKVEITIKGFASPLNSTDYNINLSKRRIQSLINYYQNIDSGFFNQYIENGQLSFIREAFGEDTADFNISDDLNDVQNSVYSPAAANERKIKVIAVSFNQ